MDVSVTSPAVWEQALVLFGDESKATRWLTTRLSELGNRTPGEVLQESPNSEAVLAILDRIDYGVFAYKLCGALRNQLLRQKLRSAIYFFTDTVWSPST